ncbi:DUF4859 domain-containing protein [Actinokineospora globicatena]|uniref:Uncharacterized protein n=1 Tax=Actinokineospora globicatena TaxID=103729 RepID=A0A9W6VBS9_9PSEU|nr:DUF4859 domain-containing protein [Actinokineospora globicatena]GLW93486.1 hypothetical protein Aglo03_43020 [Actinokineospora globicatena]
MLSRKLTAIAAAVVTAGAALFAGDAAASPSRTTAVTYTYNFDGTDGDVQHDDGGTSGYWVDRNSTVARSGTKSARYRIRSFNSAGKPWIQWNYLNPQQSATLPVEISFYVRSSSGGAANAWNASAYASTVNPHSDSGSPSAGWQYQSITHTANTWAKYTFTTTVNTVSQPELNVAVGISAAWPSTRTYYIDDVVVKVG